MLDLSDLAPPISDPTAAEPTIVVDIVVPVHDDEDLLAEKIAELHAYLTVELPLRWRITVVDSASADDTLAVATWLSRALPGVRALHLQEPGRGWALRIAWTESSATVVACVDLDLASGLEAVRPLLLSVVSGESDLATGIRPHGVPRAFLARVGNVLVRVLSRTHFRDAQCPVKAVRTDLARQLVPEVEADGWWFDSELLMLADRSRVAVCEISMDTDLAGRATRPKTVGNVGELLGVAWRIVTRRSHLDLRADR